MGNQVSREDLKGLRGNLRWLNKTGPEGFKGRSEVVEEGPEGVKGLP